MLDLAGTHKQICIINTQKNVIDVNITETKNEQWGLTSSSLRHDHQNKKSCFGFNTTTFYEFSFCSYQVSTRTARIIQVHV
jgi:hypothetical protein